MAESAQYLVSARKYRPSTFRSVVGQKALTATLKNAIDSRRLAQAYLFTGPRGVGKTSCARIFAKTINCLSPTPDGEACGVCESCRAIDQGNSFNLIELDAASNNSVDDIRSLNEQVYVPPQAGTYRVFIIDEVHMLSNAAFNAFLKTLEEPPRNVIFILATTEKHKVIPTILSRCQIYDFKRITIQDMVEHLAYVAQEEGIKAESAALGVIARKADGAMRDALSIFDQVAASCLGNITYQGTIENLNVLDYDYYFRLIDAFRTGDVPSALLIYQEIREKGFDSLFFLNGLAAHVRDLMVAADARTLPLLETAEDVAARYVEQARSLPLNWYYTAMKLLGDADLAYRTASSKRLLVELALIRLSQLLTPVQPPFDTVDYTPPVKTPGAPAPVGSRPVATAAAPAPAMTADTVPSYAAPSAPPASSAPAVAPSPAPVGSRPVATAAAIPVPAPVRPAASTSSLRSVRISADTPGVASSIKKEERRNPVTQEAFASAWAIFIANNSTRHLLVSAMRNKVLVQTGPESFELTVDSPASKQSIEGAMGDVMGFIRDTLGNDRVTLSVRLSEAPAGARRLPPDEFLKKVVKENPLMADVIRGMEGEIYG